MTERYPQAWRDACLELLQARRDELHRSLGYKRMSWEPIRNDIMREVDAISGSPDDRLIRQNLESWENGAVLKDEKFYFIDVYVRKLAVSGQDARALKILKEWRFRSAAGVLESLYVRADRHGNETCGIFKSLPFTLLSHEIEGTWYKHIVLRGLRAANGVIEVVAAYLPVSLRQFKEEHFSDVVFFSGFMIPLNSRQTKTSEGSVYRSNFALKLTRPEFRGLSGPAYAEGEISIELYQDSDTNTSDAQSIELVYPSPAICPTIEDQWKAARNSRGFVKNITASGSPFIPDIIKRSSSVSLHQVANAPKYVDILFEFSYKGYVQQCQLSRHQ